MELLDRYLELRQQVFAYFGYVEGWQAFPIEDTRMFFWRLTDGQVCFAETENGMGDREADDPESQYANELLMPKSVYRGPDYTMVVVDTHTDGNRLLQIFANANERP
jgi:hypothetical protein